MTEWTGKVAQQRMLDEAKTALIASGEFRNLSDLAKLLGVDSQRLDHELDVWKERNEIFSIQSEAGELFPVFAFHRDRDLAVLEPTPRSC